MTNIATVLKAEVTRLVRKELRSEITALRKSLSVQRTDIAELKRSNKALEHAVRQLGKPASTASSSKGGTTETVRFSAKGLTAQRQRLGLSAADFGLLVGDSGQSIDKWEEGAVPRAKALQAIANLRGIGKREAAARLAALKASG